MNYPEKKQKLQDAISLIDKITDIDNMEENKVKLKMLERSLIHIIDDVQDSLLKSDNDLLIAQLNKMVECIKTGNNDQVLAKMGKLINESEVILKELKRN